MQCIVCDEGELTPMTYNWELRDGTAVYGLECYQCDLCGADPVMPDQIERNEVRIAEAKRLAAK
jgi:hypothetical protein